MKHYTSNFILATVICLANISCSDSDDDSTQNTQPQVPVEDVDSIRYVKTVALMFDNDSVSVNYQPKYGEVLEAVTPTIYSLGFNNEKEARHWFLEHCVPTEEIDSIDSLKQDNITLNFGKYGEVKYEKSSQPTSYATIHLNLPAIKTQTQINLIPLDRWPYNAYSPFFVEDIVKRKDNQQYYICVRACEGGRKGILISFSNYWNQDKYSRVHYESSMQKKENFWMPKGASLDAWNALAQLYASNPSHFEEYMKVVAEKFPSSNILYQGAIRQLIYGYTDVTYPTEPRGEKIRFWIFDTYWDLHEIMVHAGKNSLITQDGMPRFKTENVRVAWRSGFTGWWKRPSCYLDSHSEEFTAEKTSAENYEKVLDAQDMSY